MRISVILLVVAAALLVAGICLDGWLGFALVTAANVCSLTALVRTIRSERKDAEAEHERERT